MPSVVEAETHSSSAFALAGRPVLVATDGSTAAAAAVHVALALATTHRAVIHVVSVVDTRSAPMPPALDLALAMGDAIGGSAVHHQQVVELRAALSAETGETIDWPVQIMMGTPANAIVREAQRLGAGLIILGLRRHGPIDRVVNDETARTVMQHAPCPVLGVIAGTRQLPARVLAALDFSTTSLTAALAACAVVRAGACIVLAYVAPTTASLPDDGALLIHDLGIEAAFAKTQAELQDAALSFDHVVLHHDRPGSPADLLLEYAGEAKCDLIAAGSARHGRVERWLLGSVSAALVHDGRYSVLIVPPLDTTTG